MKILLLLYGKNINYLCTSHEHACRLHIIITAISDIAVFTISMLWVPQAEFSKLVFMHKHPCMDQLVLHCHLTNSTLASYAGGSFIVTKSIWPHESL